MFLSAGEASGDHYGAQIITELLRRNPDTKVFGLGGREMESAGQERIVRAEDVAHMGITEVIKHAPRVYGSYRRLVASIKQRRPDAAVLIDFPDVNLRLARELKVLNIPVVYFVSPQLWAWKRRRLRWVQQRVDRMMVIFPFEEPFYRNRNVNAIFTGHPLAELPLPTTAREDYAAKATEISQDQWLYCGGPEGPGPVDIPIGAKDGEVRYQLDPHKPWIALLPGSRISEIRNNLPIMIEAAYDISGSYEFIVPLAQTITERQLKGLLYDTGDFYLGQTHPPRVTFVRDARAALHHARASIIASGTATVQAAVIGNPFVVVYKVSPLTFKLAKRLVSYPPEVWSAGPDAYGNLPIAMVNLIAGRRIVPELIQENFTAASVASALRPLLDETPERSQMIADLAQVRQKLLPPQSTGSISQVVDAVEALMAARSGNPTNTGGRIQGSSV